MDSKRYAHIKSIFAQAREMPLAQRAAYLDDTCSGDPELRAEIDELLAEDERPTRDPLARALAEEGESQLDLPTSQPQKIGKYRILGICGSGGMGTVYEAEQDAPQRRVALKVIQSTILAPEVRRRFRREAEVLARLQHPCIAQVFEAGEFEQDGVSRPYFAMEYVDGPPLMEHAKRAALNVTGCVDIFVRICDAIHHAHEQGVVHRDLKPDNILVLEKGTSTSDTTWSAGHPKVLDFGVARLADPDIEVTMSTAAGQLLGSVPYMSPEQASGRTEEIDGRSDLYALGVLLFELLTGRLPYDVRGQSLPDALHTIRHGEPTRLGTADPNLRGDLETIVGKCLEKDRARRYDSVAQLIQDLRRYRELRPITARPPSTWYQLRRFAQRNRALVGGAAATALALIAGTIATLIFAINAARHAAAADANLDDFNRLSFVVRLEKAKSVERHLYPAWPDKSDAMREWLANEAKDLVDAVPELRATLTELEKRAAPRTDAERAVAIRTHARGPELVAMQQQLAVLARAHAVRSGSAEPEAFALDESKLPTSATELDNLARRFIAPKRTTFGREAEGLALAERALAVAPERGLGRAIVLTTLAWALFAVGRDREAIEQSNAAVAAAGAQRAMVEKSQKTLEAAIAAAPDTHADLVGRVSGLEAEIVGLGFEDDADVFLHDTLRALVADIDAFAKNEVAKVETRLVWAERVEELTVKRHQKQWNEARSAILKADGVTASKLYGEVPIELTAQMGLIPLGMNPVSKLWEFYHLRSAWDGTSDPATIALPSHPEDGSIEVTGDTGIVFVLLPGGTYTMGAQKSDPSGPNYDAQAKPEETPHKVTLGPFFLARHELTQGQWARLWNGDESLRRPAVYGPGYRPRGAVAAVTLAHPVEQVDWSMCDEMLTRQGLVLPTEAQWEYGCRGTTTTPYGCEFVDLKDFANVADATVTRAGLPWTCESWADGHIVHAPVGTFGANQFGLYDVHGNVREWCQDWFGRYDSERPGDGLREQTSSSQRVYRGGSYSSPAVNARSAYRLSFAPTIRSNSLGLRPARTLLP